MQRLGRTGRRAGTIRNCLFLTTSDENFLRAAALARLWSDGYIEPVRPPAMPLHLLAQQLMALALQQGGIGFESWRDWIGRMPGFAHETYFLYSWYSAGPNIENNDLINTSYVVYSTES